jgi:molybdopterin converting factor small subunit
MSVTFRLPEALRDLAGGRAEVAVEGRPSTVGDALASLRRDLPAVHDRLVTERGELREHVNLFVGRESVRFTGGLDTAIGPDERILVLPAVSGG